MQASDVYNLRNALSDDCKVSNRRWSWVVTLAALYYGANWGAGEQKVFGVSFTSTEFPAVYAFAMAGLNFTFAVACHASVTSAKAFNKAALRFVSNNPEFDSGVFYAGVHSAFDRMAPAVISWDSWFARKAYPKLKTTVSLVYVLLPATLVLAALENMQSLPHWGLKVSLVCAGLGSIAVSASLVLRLWSYTGSVQSISP